MKKILVVAICLIIAPSLCFATYFNHSDCSNSQCTSYPTFKITWYGPDGIHVWERVCNLEARDYGAWWSFCVNNKTVIVTGAIIAEQLP